MIIVRGRNVIHTIEEFIAQIRKDCSKWNTNNFPWFRGEPDCDTPLLPKLFRQKEDGTFHDENQLLQFFRMKAPALGMKFVPPRSKHTDQWLFLAQHFGLPTRLLDWSEGALIALYFAVRYEKPIVWMMDPIELNRLSSKQDIKDNEFPLTWHQPKGSINIGYENIRCAWEKGGRGIDFPVAVHPSNIHPRMSAQKSCFTIHGKIQKGLNELQSFTYLKKYVINPDCRCTIFKELRLLGISCSALFFDLDGLSKELSQFF